MMGMDMGAQRLHQEQVGKTLNHLDKKEVFAGSVKDFRPTQDYVVVYSPKFNKETKTGIVKGEAQQLAELAALPKAFEVASVGEKVDKSVVNVGQYVLVSRAEGNPYIESD